MESGHKNFSCSFIPDVLWREIATDSRNSSEVRAAASYNLTIGQSLHQLPVNHNQSTNEDEVTIYPSERWPLRNNVPVDPSKVKRLLRDAECQETLGTTHWVERGDDTFFRIFQMLGLIYNFFETCFNFEILDGKGTILCATLHYGDRCGNAYWSNKDKSLFIGDGDEYTTKDFTSSKDVLAHEITHGIIGNTSQLEYYGETGALNEHLADVFGLLFKQYKEHRNDDPRLLSWQIGDRCIIQRHHAGILASDTSGAPESRWTVGRWSDRITPPYLRCFKEPRSGIIPQPKRHAEYEEYMEKKKNSEVNMSIEADHGGVHTFSGIPNFAFYNAAIRAKGRPWEGVGAVWFRAMINPWLGSKCTFLQFARETISQARTYWPHLEQPIREGWCEAGIVC